VSLAANSGNKWGMPEKSPKMGLDPNEIEKIRRAAKKREPSALSELEELRRKATDEVRGTGHA
jgi:hypothetical protein